MKPPDILAAIKPVVEAFEKLGVHYYIGGSVASSAYGIARATLDVDMVSEGAARFTGYEISSVLGIRIRAYKSVKTGLS